MKRTMFTRLIVLGLGLAVGALALADDKEEAIKRDRQQIQGTWRVVALTVNGNEAQAEDARKLVVINGDDGTWTLLSEGQQVSKGSSTFDPTQTPKAIDFTATEGDAIGKVHLGIYELGDNTRKMCFAPEGMTRPTKFTSEPGSGHVCLTFEREKSQ